MNYLDSAICLRYLDDGAFVALDHSSGGYPYKVPASQAYNFKTMKNAADYASYDPNKFEIVELKYEVVWASRPEKIKSLRKILGM